MSESHSSRQSAADLRSRIQQAALLAQSGRPEDAEQALREILRHRPDTVEAHSFLGSLYFRQQRYGDALAANAKAVTLEPGNFSLHLNLGMAQEETGDLPGAVKSYLQAFRLNPRDARSALFAGAALEAAGRQEDAAVMFTFGDDVSSAVRTAKDQPENPPELRSRSETADRVIREHFSRLHAKAVDEIERLLREEAESGKAPDISRVRNAIWVQTHVGPFEFRTARQKPSVFYLPDLEPVHIVPLDRLPWARAIEAAADAVRKEYLAAIEGGVRMTPYVDANVRDPAYRKLGGQMDWSSLHLFWRGEPTPAAARFPETLKALESADTVRVGSGNPIEVFFSRLKPDTHIPEHFGEANNRLTVHLPLIVPDNCAIRVKNDIHEWREGEVFAFDDSFEHEAWNRSDSDRVVLIFEAHHPDLRPEERRAIEHVFNVRSRWVEKRRIPEVPDLEEPV